MKWRRRSPVGTFPGGGERHDTPRSSAGISARELCPPFERWVRRASEDQWAQVMPQFQCGGAGETSRRERPEDGRHDSAALAFGNRSRPRRLCEAGSKGPKGTGTHQIRFLAQPGRRNRVSAPICPTNPDRTLYAKEQSGFGHPYAHQSPWPRQRKTRNGFWWGTAAPSSPSPDGSSESGSTGARGGRRVRITRGSGGAAGHGTPNPNSHFPIVLTHSSTRTYPKQVIRRWPPLP
jgi:hypothetical protein